MDTPVWTLGANLATGAQQLQTGLKMGKNQAFWRLGWVRRLTFIRAQIVHN